MNTMHTVGEEKFLAWYRKNAKKSISAEKALQRVHDSYFEDASEVFVLCAEETKSGEEARYEFRVENIGCCGASTLYYYF